MKTFALKINKTTYYCDTDGRVSDIANVIGTWQTTDDNSIRITPQTGAAIDAAVDWRFNEQNQLVISQNNTPVITIHNDTNELPRFWLSKNVLHIDPDGDGNFEFPLKCQWGLDAAGNLRVTINGTTSTLDGYIEDTRSRFRFQFYDKDLPNYPSSLVFNGSWERLKTASDKDIRLHFVLENPKLEDPKAPLNLPEAVKVDPMRNHLALVYQSKTYGERRLEFLGSMEIRQNWTLTFKIADSKDAVSGVRSTKITVDTTFAWDAASGTISLYVGREKSAGQQVIEVGGNLQANLKQGTLSWTFAYRKITAGGSTSVTLTLATEMTFEFKNGKIWVKYTQAGRAWTLDVTAKLVQKDFVLSGGVSIKNDPDGRRIGAFLSISFKSV